MSQLHHPQLRPPDAEPLHSARLRLVSRLEQRRGEIAELLVDTYRAEIFAYGSLDDAETLAEVKRSARLNADAATQAIADDGELGDGLLLRHAQIGRQRAAQGFPLHAVIAALQITARVFGELALDELRRLRVDPEVAAALAPRVCLVVLDYTTRVAATVTDAYRAAEQDLSETEHALRREVFDELLIGPRSDTATVTARARAMGFRLGETHIVAVVTVEGLHGYEAPAVESVRRKVAETVQRAFSGLPAVMVQRRGNAEVMILPASLGDRDAVTRETLDAVLSQEAIPSELGWFASVGRQERGVAGIAASYRQALRAHDAAKALGLGRRVVPYEETLPALLLLQDAALADDVFRATVAPLARYDAERDGQLVETLDALFEAQGNTLAAAKLLFVHRHTLTARLKRIEQLTGRSLRDRADLLLFELGLLARHVLPSRRRGL